MGHKQYYHLYLSLDHLISFNQHLNIFNTSFWICFKATCLLAKAGLELIVQMRLVLNFWFSYFYFPLNGIYAVLGIEPEASCMLGQLLQLNSMPSPWRLLPFAGCNLISQVRCLFLGFPRDWGFVFPDQNFVPISMFLNSVQRSFVVIVQYLAETKGRT